MKIKKIIFILCSIFLLCGCQKSQDDIADNEYKVEYETRVNGAITSYVCNNKEYSYLLTLEGRSSNASRDCYYKVLSKDEKLDFKEVDIRFWSSSYNDDEQFCIIEYGLIEDEYGLIEN